MIFEIITTSSMLGIAGFSWYKQKTSAIDDHEKIEKIAENVGLFVREDKVKKKIRLHRKTHDKNTKSTEYVYQIPLGLEFDDFLDKKGKFVDGLNNISVNRIDFAAFKTLKFDKDIITQIKKILNHRMRLSKEIEMEYDGMLKFIVYEEGLKEEYLHTKEIIEGCKKWQVALGRTYKETIYHNFEKAPHILIGGATDMGKSTILNIIIATLIHNHPDEVEFTLIDLKGGLEFGPYQELKQVKNFADDVSSAKTALEKVQKEMSDTFELLRRKNKRKVQEAGIKNRHFVIIDEAAELSSDHESDSDVKKLKIDCENLIKDIARRGRASGIRLLYATQNPTSEVISSQVKRNLITRIALPVDTSTASNVILDESGAEELPLIPGRAIYKHNRTKVMQAYKIDDQLIDDITTPHIVFKPRSEQYVDAPHEKRTDDERGKYITEFEEIGLLDQKPTSKTPQFKK